VRPLLRSLIGPLVATASLALVVSFAPASAAATPVGRANTTRTNTAPILTATPAAGIVVTLTGMNPAAPAPDPSTEKVTFTATVTNNTDVGYNDLQVQLQRAAPVIRQDLLDQAIKSPPVTDNVQTTPLDTKQALPAHASAQLTYSSSPQYGAMCLCDTGIYPFALVVTATSPDGTVGEIGRTQILVPSFLTKPAPVQVAWIWPLIDQPHRGLADTIFTDDKLATSVSPNGRLDRALQVAERATAAGIHLTLITDPELLDSLAVMAAGYQYRLGKTTVKGTGGPAAALWLARLKALQARQEIVLTAYADPDIDALTRAGMTYSTALDPQVQTRLQASLGAGFLSGPYWPAGGVLSSKALDAAVSAGAASVVLSDTAAPDLGSTALKSDALTSLPSAGGQANALITDSTIQQIVTDALTTPGDLEADDRLLLSELAVRATDDPTNKHFVTIAAPRYVDADPTAALALITASTHTPWSESIAVGNALQTVTPVARGPLRTASAAGELAPARLSAIAGIDSSVDSLRALFSSADALKILGAFSAAIKRAQSNSWRQNPGGQIALIQGLTDQINGLTAAVHLVQPTNGTYSLSSQDSPVVVTVENSLAQAVTVGIAVSATRGVIGFRAQTLSQSIPAHSKSTISIPTHVDRLGKFKVVATLQTPDGRQLGQTVPMTLRVTAIGGITKAITGIAGLVLIVALLLRFYRRIRRRGGTSGPAVGPRRPGRPPAHGAAQASV
jgi:hypothetical protein